MLNAFQYCPYFYKHEFVEHFVKHKGWTRSQANKLKRNQLRKIWLDQHLKSTCNTCPDYDVDEDGQMFEVNCSNCQS